jgi:hypothetical protein
MIQAFYSLSTAAFPSSLLNPVTQPKALVIPESHHTVITIHVKRMAR